MRRMNLLLISALVLSAAALAGNVWSADALIADSSLQGGSPGPTSGFPGPTGGSPGPTGGSPGPV